MFRYDRSSRKLGPAKASLQAEKTRRTPIERVLASRTTRDQKREKRHRRKVSKMLTHVSSWGSELREV